MTERSKKALATRGKLLDSARKLIGQSGYDSVTVDDIVADCGVAKGTFYHYFKSKSDILSYLSDSFYETIQASEALDGHTGLMGRLHGFVSRWFKDVSTNNLHFAREAIRLYTTAEGGEYGEKVSHMDQGIELIRSYLSSALDSGELKAETPVDTIAKALMFSLQGSTLYQCKHDRDFDVMAWKDEFIQHVLNPLLEPWLAKKA